MGRSEQFFHGTLHDIPVGHLVLPADASGHSNYVMRTAGGKSSNTVAFATTNESVAWEYGQGMRGDVGRSRVYRVKPHPDMQPGLYNSKHPGYNHRSTPMNDLHEYIAPHFQVAERIDIKPPNERGEAHQGTLPVNWQQFTKGEWRHRYVDINHPSPSEHSMDLHELEPVHMKPPPHEEVRGQLSLP